MILVIRSMNLPGIEDSDQLDKTLVRIASPMMIGRDNVIVKAFDVHKDPKIVRFDDSGSQLTSTCC